MATGDVGAICWLTRGDALNGKASTSGHSYCGFKVVKMLWVFFAAQRPYALHATETYRHCIIAFGKA